MTTITQTGRNKLKLNRLTKTQFENIQNINNDELYLVDPEFTGGKVLGTDVNGDIVETNITSTSVVTDVQTNGTSVVSSGVANIPAAALNGVYGVVKLGSITGGLSINSSNNLYVSGASQSQIESKLSNVNQPIMPAQIDTAVKVGITTNTTTLTDAEKLAANTWIGSLQNVKVNGTALTKDANNAVDIGSAIPNSVKQIAKAGTGIEFNDKADQNYTIVGTGVTVTDGVASGFSTSSYLSVDSPIKKYATDVSDTFTSFEMGAKVKIASGSGQAGGYVLGQQRTSGSSFISFADLSLSPGSGSGRLAAYFNGGSASINTLTINRDTDYWIKLSWTNGNKVEVYLSTDGTTYTKQAESSSAISSPSSAAISALTSVFTAGARITSTTSAFGLGSMDLREAYVKVNDTEVWRGVGETSTYIESGLLKTGASSPTTSTVGFVGQFYIDTTNEDAYICVSDASSTYTWKKITP